MDMEHTDQPCRLCLAPSPEKNGFISDPALRSKLDLVFRFELPLEESLPAVVCHECSAIIDEFYSYHETVRSNQNQLTASLTSDANMPLLVEVKGEPGELADDGEKEDQVDDADENESQDDTDVKDEHDSVQSDLDELDITDKSDDREEKEKRSMEDNLKIEQFFSGKIPCSDCSAVLQTFDLLKEHGREKHGKNASAICCKQKYFKKCLLVEHVNVHLDPTYFRCKLCNKNYACKSYLQVHTAKIHASPEQHRFQCSKCGKKYPRESMLTAHLKRHIKIKCTVCDRMMSNAQALRVHMQVKHSKESAPNHICDTCGQSYNQKQKLERHINVQHLGIKDTDRIQCPVCAKWVNSKYYLRLHTQIAHSGENLQVTCEICHQVYPNQRALASHKNMVHRERNVVCDICGKNLKHPKHLKEHRAAHMGQRLYSCTVCNYTSNYNANLYAHMKSKHAAQWAQVKARGGPLFAEHKEPMGAEID